MKGLLVAGTDTGVGKTTVARGLLALARRRGLALVPFKPAETGFDAATSDAAKLLDASGRSDLALADVCPFPLSEPVAPAVAARLAGITLLPATIVNAARRMASRGAALLIEAAGGILTPYGPAFTAATLAELLDIDVLIVAANRLGTINHTALTVAELRRRRLRCAGLILVDTSAAATPDRPFNAAEIAASSGLVPLGTLRYCPSPVTADEIADALLADVRLDGLLAGALLTASPAARSAGDRDQP
jgi:dethiobiotin synthetase